MATLVENRTISMILTVPNTKTIDSPLSRSVDNLNQKGFSYLDNRKPPSIPVYYGSIIHIEQNHDIDNTSDLIVRVPNFRNLSLSSVTITTGPTSDDQYSETDSQRERRIKRRAPICPIINDLPDRSMSLDRINNSNLNQLQVNTRLSNTRRLADGLRNLSRAFTTSNKPKQSSTIKQLTIIPMLPDVEVITENLQELESSKKPAKNLNLTSKSITPKILYIKRKYFKIKRKHSSSESPDPKIDIDDSKHEYSTNIISCKDADFEQQHPSKPITSTEFDHETEQQPTTIGKLIPKIPISLIEPDSSSTHGYSKLSEFSSNIPRRTTDFNSEDILSPIRTTSDRFSSKEEIDLTIDKQRSIHIYEQRIQHDDVDDKLFVHPNDDTYSECYEVTYELDPEYQQYLDNEKEQVHLSKIEEEEKSSNQFNTNSFVYEGLSSTITSWVPIIPRITLNDYEQDANEKSQISTNFQAQTKSRVKFYSIDDSSQSTYDETSNSEPKLISIVPISHDNQQTFSYDQTPTIDEDYTVILQLLRRALQLDTSNEFNQLSQTDTMNTFEQE